MAIRMLLKVGLKLLASVAVLDGIPERKIERLRGDFLGCRRGGTWRRPRRCMSRVRASGAKVPSGYSGREADFESRGHRHLWPLSQSASSRRDLVVGGQFGEQPPEPGLFLVARRHPRGSEPPGRRCPARAKAKGADRVGDVLDQLLAQILEDHAAAMAQVIAHTPRSRFATFDQPLDPGSDVDGHRRRCRRP